MRTLSLGPFDLCWPIGTGGASIVWEAVHRQRDMRVAIKILPPEGSQPFNPSFLKEIRAVSELDHPNVVQMFDYGFVTASDAQPNTELMEGSPFLIMELARRGCLKTRPPTTWEEARDSLTGILSGLAHAHALGLVHRDIKPSNILVGDRHPLLTDFGLAERFIQEDGGNRRVARSGTPGFMAPEQYEGRYRDFGPWTDLYALGCLAWTLTTGHPPSIATGKTLETAHLTGTFDAYQPRFSVPSGLESWLMGLLSADPYCRFRRAADAQYALETLSEPCTSSLPRRRPPIPPTWPSIERRRESRIPDVGLGLFGMRAIPLIDRQDERALLWKNLSEVHEHGHARAVILKGATGVGKSHLAQALCNHAEATGSARALWATHGRIATKTHGIAGMLMRLLNARGLDRDGVGRRSQTVMTALHCQDIHTWLALAEVARLPNPNPGRQENSVPLMAQQNAIVTQLFRHLGNDRPTILWIDDAQWGAEALSAALAILNSEEQIPTLIVVTVQEEALEQRPDERALVQRLMQCTEVHVRDLKPLRIEHHRALLDHLLQLEPSLAERVAQETCGNPQFAVHLIGDWVDRGVLTFTREGYILSGNADSDIPPGVEVVWDQKIERVLASRPLSDEIALELAACLGQNVEVDEWAAVCGHADLTPSADLLEALSRVGLARAYEGGWSFTDDLVRDRVNHRTRLQGRHEEAHRLCALGLSNAPNYSERLGTHLMAAGAFAEALKPLAEAILFRGTRSEFGLCRSLILTYDTCVTAAQLGNSDPRAVMGQLAYAEVLIMEGDLDRAGTIVEEIAIQVQQNSWPRTGGRCWKIRAEIAMRRGHLNHAKDLLIEALDQFQPISISHLQTRLSHIHIQLGELESARTAGEAAVKTARHATDRRCGHGELAYIAKCQGRLDDAEWHLAKAMPNEDDDRYLLAHVYNLQGEILREKRDFARAEVAYQQSLAIWRAIGVSNRALYSSLNLGILRLLQGRFDEVGPVVGPVRDEASRLQLPNVMAIADIALLSPNAALGKWDDFDRHFSAWSASICREALFDTDLARMLQMAGEIASDARHFRRAEPLFRDAAEQWRQLGFPTRAEQCGNEALNALGLDN